MNKTLKYILFSTLLILSLAFIVLMSSFSLKSSENKICSNVDVIIKDYSTKQLINNDDVIQFLNNNQLNPIGKLSHQISSSDIEKSLAKHPMIKRIDCYKTPFGNIKIKIEQRTPILRVMAGEDYYVDTEGEIIPIVSNNKVYIPIATGRISKSLATNELIDFIKYVNNDELWLSQIEQIHVNSQNKVQIVPRVGDHIIILGSFDNFAKKLNRLKEFYVNGLNIAGWDAYSTIDLSFDNQVVCTRKN